MDGTSHLRAVVPKHVHELTGLYRIDVVPVDAPTHLSSSGKSSNIVSEVVSSIVGSSSLWYRITTLARNPESKELHTHSADKNTDSGDVSIEKSDSIRDTGVPDAANQEIIDGNDNDTLSSPNSSSSQNAHLIEDEDAFGGGRDDFIESIAIKKNLTTYVVHRSLEHFVWFRRQFTEKEPFLLVGELPNSLTSAIEDPLGTTDQITAMLFFMATGALTASDPLLWSLLAVPDEDFYKQFEDLISSEKKDDDTSGGEKSVAATELHAFFQEGRTAMKHSGSIILPLHWNLNIGNFWWVSEFLKDIDEETNGNIPMRSDDMDDEEWICLVRSKGTNQRSKRISVSPEGNNQYMILKERMYTNSTDAESLSANVTTNDFLVEDMREKRTSYLIKQINQHLFLPSIETKPENISKRIISSRVIDRAFESCDRLAPIISKSMHFQKMLLKHDRQYFSWGQALCALYKLRVQTDLLQEAAREVVPLWRDFSNHTYWPWTREKIIAEEGKPKLSPRVHCSHRLTKYCHRVANILGEIGKSDGTFATDRFTAAVTLGAMLCCGHRWSCAMAHQQLHRGNKVKPDMKLMSLMSVSGDTSIHLNSTASKTVQKQSGNVSTMRGSRRSNHNNIPPSFLHACRKLHTPTGKKTGRNLLQLQLDLIDTCKNGKGNDTDIDALDLIDEEGSQIDDVISKIIKTFTDQEQDMREVSVAPAILRQIRERCLFEKFQWQSTLMLIKDFHSCIDQDLFLDVEEDLPIISLKEQDLRAKQSYLQKFQTFNSSDEFASVQMMRNFTKYKNLQLNDTNSTGKTTDSENSGTYCASSSIIDGRDFRRSQIHHKVNSLPIAERSRSGKHRELNGNPFEIAVHREPKNNAKGRRFLKFLFGNGFAKSEKNGMEMPASRGKKRSGMQQEGDEFTDIPPGVIHDSSSIMQFKDMNINEDTDVFGSS